MFGDAFAICRTSSDAVVFLYLVLRLGSQDRLGYFGASWEQYNIIIAPPRHAVPFGTPLPPYLMRCFRAMACCSKLTSVRGQSFQTQCGKQGEVCFSDKDQPVRKI